MLILTLVLFFGNRSVACDEEQSNSYVAQLLFGDKALSKASDENVKMLLDALYLCSEQADGSGQHKIDFLTGKGVAGVPKIADIDIKEKQLLECMHCGWEKEPSIEKKSVYTYRKGILKNTINKIFDFGLFNRYLFGGGEKCESFAAFLYYSHILADYLADNPEETRTVVRGKETPAYVGSSYIELRGNIPSFTAEQKKITKPEYSSLDGLGRAGPVISIISSETIANAEKNQSISSIYPSGWNQKEYPNMISANQGQVYNRCHLLAKMFGGKGEETNLVTGTRYMNEAIENECERKIQEYFGEEENKGNHVLYRVTPHFRGSDKICSGIQIEAYSIEDEKIRWNKYFYNVQPGIRINYTNGKTERIDYIEGEGLAIPFAVANPSDDNPDLIYEMVKHLEVLFENEKNTGVYVSMMDSIETIAYEARGISDNSGYNTPKRYLKMKDLEYKFFIVLRDYVPLLLEDQTWFDL